MQDPVSINSSLCRTYHILQVGRGHFHSCALCICDTFSTMIRKEVSELLGRCWVWRKLSLVVLHHFQACHWLLLLLLGESWQCGCWSFLTLFRRIITTGIDTCLCHQIISNKKENWVFEGEWLLCLEFPCSLSIVLIVKLCLDISVQLKFCNYPFTSAQWLLSRFISFIVQWYACPHSIPLE